MNRKNIDILRKFRRSFLLFGIFFAKKSKKVLTKTELDGKVYLKLARTNFLIVAELAYANLQTQI